MDEQLGHFSSLFFLITNNAFNYLVSYSTHMTETDKCMLLLLRC